MVKFFRKNYQRIEEAKELSVSIKRARNLALI